MAFQDPQEKKGLLSEINVTPLVDVMLVLLIIFMITASMETLQMHKEKERIEEKIAKKEFEDLNQKVPVELPKTNAEKVNLSEEKKVVLSMTDNLDFYIGETMILSCTKVSPNLGKFILIKKWDEDLYGKDFSKCLNTMEEKIKYNEKLKKERELYLRAPRTLHYGVVLKVMAKIRKAGILKFGLIAEPELME